jgi:hypothetical protein
LIAGLVSLRIKDDEKLIFPTLKGANTFIKGVEHSLERGILLGQLKLSRERQVRGELCRHAIDWGSDLGMGEPSTSLLEVGERLLNGVEVHRDALLGWIGVPIALRLGRDGCTLFFHILELVRVLDCPRMSLARNLNQPLERCLNPVELRLLVAQLLIDERRTG